MVCIDLYGRGGLGYRARDDASGAGYGQGYQPGARCPLAAAGGGKIDHADSFRGSCDDRVALDLLPGGGADHPLS